jgi:transposase
VSARRPRSSAWTHFHVVAWAIKALDKLRVRTMTKAGITDRHAMWAVHKTRPI